MANTIIIVPAQQIRNLFNQANLVAQVRSGALTAQIRSDKHPSAPKANEPYCTRSQVVTYYDSRSERVAVVHQYLRPDGSLGASGQPDPKLVVLGGVEYRVQG